MPDDIEAPEADTAEQETEVAPQPTDASPREVPLEAEPADVVEQMREVGVNDDDYR